MSLQEEDYKGLLLEHYTFLKRPVAVEDAIFIGNAKKNIEALTSLGKLAILSTTNVCYSVKLCVLVEYLHQ